MTKLILADSVNSPTDYTTAPRGELVRKIYALEDKVATLEAQLAELRSRLDTQGPKPQDIPPAFIKANAKHKKKPEERCKRKENFTRHRDIPTKYDLRTLAKFKAD